MHILTFCKKSGLPILLPLADFPQYEKNQKIVVYSKEELQRLFATADPEFRLLLHFLLGSGARYKECTNACSSDIDFVTGHFLIREKKDLRGSRTKSHRARSIPLPSDLLALLAERRTALPLGRLIFPTRTGGVRMNLLKQLKKVAYQAGLNCGSCMSRSGQSCQDHPVCSRWWIHRLRKSYATHLHRAGVPLSVLRGWLGHSSINVTMSYVSDETTPQMLAQMNTTFSGLLPPPLKPGPVLAQKVS